MPVRHLAQWFRGVASLCVTVTALGATACAAERTEGFDRDPGWDGRNHRSTAFEPRRIVQDFGYSPTQHAGGHAAGEMGGMICPAGEAAYYGKKIGPFTLNDKLTASGTLNCTSPTFHALIGFFNADTLNEWRTPNTIAMRINGRGDRFFAYTEYCTGQWRAGGDYPGGFATEPAPETGRQGLRGFALDKVHHWTMTYDPQANDGNGSITVTIDDETCVCQLSPGHKQDGAEFNRFGLLPVMKSWDDPGEVWLDDVTVNGEEERFDNDPHWDERGNRRIYASPIVRPRFDFGFSPTHFAGGAQAGELGGLVFRGDIREPQRSAYYGDRIAPVSMKKPLHASGTVAMRRAVSDSTMLLGFFHHELSTRTNPSQSQGFPSNFLGIAVEGPSSEGFYFYPCYCDSGSGMGYADGPDRPRILPDGAVHRWRLDYDPAGGAGHGEVKVQFDDTVVRLEVTEADRRAPTWFDRFGIVTTWIDGNSQQVYFDELAYTCSQE